LDWTKKGKADISKLKLRYYAENYRGLHTAVTIKNGETIAYIPLDLLITIEMAYKSPIGSQMYEKGLHQRISSPKHTFLGIWLLQERKKESTKFA